MNTKQAYPRLMEALEEVRRQWRRHKLLEGALLAAGGTVAVLLTLVFIDNWIWQSGAAGRLVLAALLWGGLAVGLLYLVVKRFLEDRRDDFFAALVEQKYPGLHNKLINALQLGRGEQRGMSAELIDAIVHDADKATVELDMRESVDPRPSWRAAGVSLAVLLLLGVYAVAAPERFGNGLARVLLPLGNIPPYTQTQILTDSILPGDTQVSEGSPITFEVRVTGVVPTKAKLQRRTVKGANISSDMEPTAEDDALFRFEIKQAAESFDYWIAAGDARTRTYRVNVVKAPRIESLVVNYERPSYTGDKPRQLPSPSGKIADLAGTRVTIEIKTSKPIQDAILKVENENDIMLDKDDDLRTLRASFVIWTAKAKQTAEIKGRLVHAPTTYQIHLTDTDGYTSKDPLWRSIELVQDQPPQVAILSAGDRMTHPLGAVLTLPVEASDDHGLASVRVRARINNEDAVWTLASFDHRFGPPQQRTSDRFTWALNKTVILDESRKEHAPLKVGDHVDFWAEAGDRNDITGPGKGESRRYSIDVVNPADIAANLEINAKDFATLLAAILKKQKLNRAKTAEAVAFPGLVATEAQIRNDTRKLARLMESEGVPLATMVQGLDNLAAGLMGEAIALLEKGMKAQGEALQGDFRNQSLPVQDKIIAELEAMLARLQRNEQARQALKRLEKNDKAAHKNLTTLLTQMIKDLNSLLKDQTELAGKFDKMPKKTAEEVKEDTLKALKDLEDLKKRAEKWAKGSVLEMGKLPQGFIDDFNLRKDVNRIYEEIEKCRAPGPRRTRSKCRWRTWAWAWPPR